MLWVGLSGGIGSGKSTVSRSLAARGAAVIDADLLAREVVAPGSTGLAEVVDRFGPEVLTSQGELDRPALGRIVFGDPQARRDLEAITHPLVRELTLRRRRELPSGTIAVHDIPLLVEIGAAPSYHLVVIVGADEQVRTERLLSTRGMSPDEAQSRMTAQADDDKRRAVADVWLDNSGSPDQLEAQIDRLWQRLRSYADHLQAGTAAVPADHAGVPVSQPDSADPTGRVIARVQHLLASSSDRVTVAATPSPVSAAHPVIELRTESSDEPSLACRRALAAGGFPPIDAHRHGSADPGRIVELRWVGAAQPN